MNKYFLFHILKLRDDFERPPAASTCFGEVYCYCCNCYRGKQIQLSWSLTKKLIDILKEKQSPSKGNKYNN